MFFGPIVTNMGSRASFVDTLARWDKQNFTSVKVITGWGLSGGWSSNDRAQILSLTPNPIVRTVAGDPSSRRHPLPHPGIIIDELRTWLDMKFNLMVELGNEPNIRPVEDRFIWEYRYFLDQSIDLVRRMYPHAHIIAPALIVNETAQRWFDICKDIFTKCDSVGIHAYEHISFLSAKDIPRTNQLSTVNAMYEGIKKPKVMTEYGINDSKVAKVAKLTEYRQMLPVLRTIGYIGATFYHVNVKEDIDPQYHIPV